VVGHFDHHTGQSTPARPRAGQTVVCAIESLQVDPDPDPDEPGAIPQMPLPTSPLPSTQMLPVPAPPVPPSPEESAPPAPITVSSHRRRPRPGLRSIALTIPVAAGLTLLAGRLVDRARSAAERDDRTATAAALVRQPVQPPPRRPAIAPSIEPMVALPRAAAAPQRPAPPPRRPPPAAAREEQARYTVHGVVAPDTLNVRARPDPHSAALVQIPADAPGIVASGKRRPVGASTWWEVSYRGHRGWVNGRFLAPQDPGPR
jgi:hypothetical protein